ncbi:SNF2-related protein [Paenibacillus sp. FSL H8-0260]|uniref:SNF2-related protein n=1 Tax=Paenibacillus sp. FSL H8-0260 TaxID=2921380 RepID=UPI00324BCE59
MPVLNYETYQNELKEHVNNPIVCLFYAIMCRRWDEVCTEAKLQNLKWDEIKGKTFKDTQVTIEKCLSKNMQFLRSNKKKVYYENLIAILGNGVEGISVDKNIDYDSKDFYEGKSVFEVFFDGNQPVLDVKYFGKQTLAAQQLQHNRATMVLDEVGTGKTVAGIYAIQHAIQNRLKATNPNDRFPSAAIILICPYLKREDWHNDIKRQLGRNSTIISQSDNGYIIKQKSANPNKPLIYIMGCSNGTSDDSHSALKKSFKAFLPDRNWDLVIIDECHNCFDNYKNIRADQVMLLTATPIIVKGGNVRDFSHYKSLMKSVLGLDYYAWNHLTINPIETTNPTEQDIFVCNYKEDIFNVNIKRKITFIPCERTKERQAWFSKLRDEKDFFTAMYADQDDNRLAAKMQECFHDDLQDYSIDKNAKLQKLKEIVSGDGDYSSYKEKSILIFCELQATVEMIYDQLSYLSNETVLIAKKYSSIGEIKNITRNPEIVIEQVKTHIRAKHGNRSILVTTGKSGGTGLNMGEFHTVVHYELPYTNNELEQRFGRIERADDLIVKSSDSDTAIKIENEMIFLVNKPNEAQDNSRESDFITNRMLYYAVNKINKACEYMPIRNTVLFHPDFTSTVTSAAQNYFTQFNQICDSDTGQELISAFINYKKQEQNVERILAEIKKSLSSEDQAKVNDANHLCDKITTILTHVTNNDTISQHSNILTTFRDIDNSRYIAFEKIIDEILEYYIWLHKTLKLWGVNLTTSIVVESEDTYSITNDHMDIEMDDSNYNMQDTPIFEHDTEKLFRTILSMRKAIIDETYSLAQICEAILISLPKDNINQDAAGIFFWANGKFQNKSVATFRMQEGGLLV